MSSQRRAEPQLYAGIFLVALATLLFELTLIRVLSFTIWHHFAYVVLSTALLGFGASGSFLAIRSSFGKADLRSTLALCSIAAALCCVGAIFFVAYFPLSPILAFQPGFAGQKLRLLTYPIVCTLPFFFAGLVVSLILRADSEEVDRLYFFDLVGGGLGCVAAVALMNLLTPPGAALLCATFLAAAAAVFATKASQRGAAAVLAIATLAASLAADRLPFVPAATKEMALTASSGNFVGHFTKWTALFRTDVQKRVVDRLPETRSFGLSGKAPDGLEQPAFYVSHDATAGTGIYDLHAGRLEHLDYHILKLPYLVAPAHPKVLVIGVGGGRDVVNAVQHGARHVTGVELDPVTVDYIQHRVPETNGFFTRPEVELHAGEGRHFVRASRETYDLIQITGVDTLAAASSGAYVLAENYLYTIEAVHDYLDHLGEEGVLSFAMVSLRRNAPLSAGRMAVMMQIALRERGIEEPWQHIAAISSKRLYAEVMVRMKPFTREEVRALLQVSNDLDFMPLALPFVQTRRHDNQVWPDLVRFEGAEREALLDSLEYTLTPTTDDRPFFQRYFRWSDLLRLDILEKIGRPNDASPLGQIVLAVLLVLLTGLGALFIIAPLIVFQRRDSGSRGGSNLQRIGVLSYFLSIGLGFMLFEISLMQRFVLFLGYPTYSLSITLGSLLLSLGCGSALSRRWVGREHIALPAGVVLIALLTVFYMFGLPRLQAPILAAPLALRAALTIVSLVPLGLVLGMFFPLGLRRAAELGDDLVPWAWAVNGCASVTATVLAVLLAMSFGFTTVWVLSLAVYAAGTFALLATTDRRDAIGSPTRAIPPA